MSAEGTGKSSSIRSETRPNLKTRKVAGPLSSRPVLAAMKPVLHRNTKSAGTAAVRPGTSARRECSVTGPFARQCHSSRRPPGRAGQGRSRRMGILYAIVPTLGQHIAHSSASIDPDVPGRAMRRHFRRFEGQQFAEGRPMPVPVWNGGDSSSVIPLLLSSP